MAPWPTTEVGAVAAAVTAATRMAKLTRRATPHRLKRVAAAMAPTGRVGGGGGRLGEGVGGRVWGGLYRRLVQTAFGTVGRREWRQQARGGPALALPLLWPFPWPPAAGGPSHIEPPPASAPRGSALSSFATQRAVAIQRPHAAQERASRKPLRHTRPPAGPSTPFHTLPRRRAPSAKHRGRRPGVGHTTPCGRALWTSCGGRASGARGGHRNRIVYKTCTVDNKKSYGVLCRHYSREIARIIIA